LVGSTTSTGARRSFRRDGFCRPYPPFLWEALQIDGKKSFTPHELVVLCKGATNNQDLNPINKPVFAPNVALSEHKSSSMAQSEDFQEDFHQAPALDGCATADVHALQKSLSDQQALTKQAESKLFEQENLTQQAQKAF